MTQYSNNEYSQLRTVIVGRADHARLPIVDLSVRTIMYSNVQNVDNIPSNILYPNNVIEEANQDLDLLCTTLKECGVTVLRPNNNPTLFYNYCPRDLVNIIGDKAFIAPMSMTCRQNDYKNIINYLDNIILLPNDTSADNFNINSVGNKDILALTEKSPKFDAANIIRSNRDLLYLVSNTGNNHGAIYLQELLGDEYRVHTLKNVYSYIHIDSTVTFLREGLLLLNPSRIPDKNILPYPFNTWDAIYCPEPIDIGYDTYNNSSIWINMNLLSVNEKLVILEQNQTNLSDELKKYGIESLMLPMRHARTLGGCFHCVTLDLWRE